MVRICNVCGQHNHDEATVVTADGEVDAELSEEATAAAKQRETCERCGSLLPADEPGEQPAPPAPAKALRTAPTIEAPAPSGPAEPTEAAHA